MSLRAELSARARALGIDVIGIAPARLDARTRDEWRAFAAAGLAGDMSPWLLRDPRRRESPERLWPEARSAICCGLNYGPGENPLVELAQRDRGYISVYARGRDYHDVFKGRLKQLAGWLHSRTGAEVKVFVDTAPLLEKPLAQKAGLGWQGKHTNLVSRRFGSWLFLGEILTTLELAPDAPERDHCGRCRRCLEICPTRAIPAPYRLDPGRCISYLTIEHRGPIPRPLRPLLGNRIYGCDDCLAVCPWNKFAHRCRELKLQARAENRMPPLAELASLDDAAFRKRFAGTPIRRIGRDRFLRNVLIAIGNSGARKLLAVVEERIGDASPLVRGAAVWALRRLADAARFEEMRRRLLAAEKDPDVRAEWLAATPESKEVAVEAGGGP